MHVKTGDARFPGCGGALEVIERLVFLSEAQVHESKAGEAQGAILPEIFQPCEYASCACDIAGEAISLAQSAEDIGKVACELQSVFQRLDRFRVLAFLNEGSAEGGPCLIEGRLGIEHGAQVIDCGVVVPLESVKKGVLLEDEIRKRIELGRDLDLLSRFREVSL